MLAQDIVREKILLHLAEVALREYRAHDRDVRLVAILAQVGCSVLRAEVLAEHIGKLVRWPRLNHLDGLVLLDQVIRIELLQKLLGADLCQVFRLWLLALGNLHARRLFRSSLTDLRYLWLFRLLNLLDATSESVGLLRAFTLALALQTAEGDFRGLGQRLYRLEVEFAL